MDRDQALWELAEVQHSLVTRRQAAAVGLGDAAVRHRIRRGMWEPVTRRVLRRTGAAPTLEQRIMTGVLHHGPDAYVARSSALALWGLPGFSAFPLELVRHRPDRGPTSSLARVHTGVVIPGTHVCDRSGIPITTPVRAIFDIAGELHPKRVARALDNAWARRLLTHATVHRTLGELAARGRPGIQLMRELAAERPASHRPVESNTEARLNDLLVADGQARLRPQVDVGDDHAWVGRVDLRDPCLPRLVIEVQSSLFHGSTLDRAADAIRRERLAASGFELEELWEDDIWHRPAEAVRKVRTARQRASDHPNLSRGPDVQIGLSRQVGGWQ